ncbi:hypothetical protein [Hirschia baltica]|uniref:Lipoprotein n=1 Tax=Hirschia baltica (strain ATCC 49814 / DSM 5838 / IFAM 1418) TaxID=582402 RepID=C6XM89_HIRBI|nr:hypothetical protein [Hirschia baltica]ACT58032.1 hypothetical protein Hbal_0330 [Hirschia baltica ATCC 49814]
MKHSILALYFGISSFALIACKNETPPQALSPEATTNGTAFSDKNLEKIQLASGTTTASMLCMQNMQRKQDYETIKTAHDAYTKRNMLKLASIMKLNLNATQNKEAKKQIDAESYKIAMELVRTDKPTAIRCNGLAKRLNAKEFDL